MHQERRRRMSFVIGENESMQNMLVALYRRDQVLGRFRMDWEHWPFQPELISQSNAWMKVIDTLYELGCWLEEQERRQAENQNE